MFTGGGGWLVTLKAITARVPSCLLERISLHLYHHHQHIHHDHIIIKIIHIANFFKTTTIDRPIYGWLSKCVRTTFHRELCPEEIWLMSLKSNIGMEWDKGILCMAWYYKGPRLEGFYLSALSNLPMGIHSAPVKGPGPASSHQRSFCRADRERTWWWMRTILAMIMTKETGDWANRSASSQKWLLQS